MAKKNLALGDLRDMMAKYKKALAAAKSTQQFDKKGNLHPVDANQVKRASEALDAAIAEVEEVCQEAVLAILVES